MSIVYRKPKFPNAKKNKNRPKLYQPCPRARRADFQDRSWKTCQGYAYNVYRTKADLLGNQAARGELYRFSLVVNDYDDLTESEIKVRNRKLAKELRNLGKEDDSDTPTFSAFFFNELTKRTNRCGLHAIIADHDQSLTDSQFFKQVRAAVKKIIPNSDVQVKRIKPKKDETPEQAVINTVNYSLKAKIRDKGGKTDDIYKRKRVLFAKDCTLRKVWCVNENLFWARARKELYGSRCDAVHKPDAEMRKNQDLREVAEWLADRIGAYEGSVHTPDTPVPFGWQYVLSELGQQLRTDPRQIDEWRQEMEAWHEDDFFTTYRVADWTTPTTPTTTPRMSERQYEEMFETFDKILA